MNNKTHSIITSILFLILFIGLIICAYHIYTINKELDTANAKITKCSIFLSEENVQSLKKEIDTSDWETYENTQYGFSLKYPKQLVTIDEYQSGEFPNSIFTVHIRNGIGGILAHVQENRCDIKNITDMHGSHVEMKDITIEKNDKITMYSYTSGDAGCEGTVTHIPMGHRTLVVKIMDCVGANEHIGQFRNEIMNSIQLQ